MGAPSPCKLGSSQHRLGGYDEKALTMLILTLFLLATAGLVFGAEMAKEGSGEGVTYFTGTSQVHAQ